MELQKPAQDLPRWKTLEATAALPKKPPPFAGSPANPTPPPTSISLQQHPTGKEGEGEQRGTKPPSTTAAAAASEGAVTSLQKKHRRAERFGMPVQLSEEEKRNSRAERFGTGSTPHGAKDAGKPEEQRRKARAERFGVAGHSVADEEAKKKARLERFGQSSKPNNMEEEKRKARAIRFSETSSAPSEANGKPNLEPNTAIAKT